jgi:hypothetical protein
LPPALHVRCLTTRPQEASCPPLRMPSWAAKSPRTPSPPLRNHWPTTNLRPNSADAVDCCSKVIPRCIHLPDRAGGCARHVEPSCSAASPPPPRRPPAAGRRHDLKSCRLTSPRLWRDGCVWGEPCWSTTLAPTSLAMMTQLKFSVVQMVTVSDLRRRPRRYAPSASPAQ